jgi:2,3-bisphosphoglycerate-independent phosphoglycerate mutase
MKLIFIFIDGLGIGDKNPVKNPIYAAKAPCLINLFENVPYAEVDVTMGIKGLPQSATGQTAIFTGVNASRAINRHLNGQPTFTLKNIINEDNLFKRLIKMGLSPTNTNVYRDEYLQNMLTLKDRRLSPSVTTVMCMSSGIPFRGVKEFTEGNGIYHDLTGMIIKENGYDVEPISPEESANRLFYISKDYDFTLFEHFMTDIIGHKADVEKGMEHILLLDRFLQRLLELVKDTDTTVFITSDHGNIEDCSIKTHTMNKVPAWIISKNDKYEKIRMGITEITDIFGAVLSIL